MIYSSRKKDFRHLFIYTIKYLTYTNVPVRLAHFCVLHQYYEVKRPKGHHLEVVVHVYSTTKVLEQSLTKKWHQPHSLVPGRVAQSVTCLTTDASLTADPGVASSIPARSHTFVEIDYKIFCTVILLPSAASFKKGCCQLQAKVCTQSTG